MTFTEMHTLIPECSLGSVRIEHRTPSSFDVMRASWRGEWLEEKPLTTLFVNNCMVMSDGPEEHRSNAYPVALAKGECLIAGLGVGMILVPLIKSPKVDFITVIEINSDVIAAVSPHLESDKLKIVNADIFEWKPQKGRKYDWIYFDIWANVCTDNLPEIAKLHQRFKTFKARGGWMGSWNHELLKYHKRQGR